ncbi:MAG TPA: hypothetical protein VF266_00960 [Thermoanaerobaculia bacterium]
MKKRLIPLLVFILVLSLAPAAMAGHCERCKLVANECAWVADYGWAICDYDTGGNCYTQNRCGPHATAALQPLAAEFRVASVERIDEPRQNDSTEIRVASLETPEAAHR